MRLGGPVSNAANDPDVWVETARTWGYGAVVFPLEHTAADDDIQRYVAAAAAAGLEIAEVGAWRNNPISPDDAIRKQGIAGCQSQLALADRVGARCCVNVAGSRGETWAGPHPDNLSEDTFALIVDSTREIIDAVNPTRTHYTIEMMQWTLPDSPESYLRLVEAIDRPGFGVHLDPANIVNTPLRFFRNADLIRECFRLLGPHIRNCHAKDVTMADEALVHIDEVRPGLGTLDYAVFLHEVSRLDPDTSLILEHLSTDEAYRAAGEDVRGVAAREGLSFVGA